MAAITSLNSIIYSWERADVRSNVLRQLNAVSDMLGDQGEEDDLSYLSTVARNQKLAGDAVMCVAVIRALRTAVSWKRNIRQPPEPIARAAIAVLDSAARASLVDALVEAAFVVLRIISDERNVFLAQEAAPPLCRCLTLPSAQLQIVSCACLQVLVTYNSARAALTTFGGTEALVGLLYSNSVDVVERALAALHTAAVDLEITSCIRRMGGVHLVITWLAKDEATAGIRKHAAGLAQNLSRDRDSAHALAEAQAVETFIPALAGSNDVELQASLVSTLLNMHTGDAASRQTLKSVLADAIACSVAESV
jgi:hypothetical protein